MSDNSYHRHTCL